MPEKDAGEPSRPKPARPPRFTRPEVDVIARAARRAVRGGKASFPSLAAFRAAVVGEVRREEPLAAVGGRRLRRLLVTVPGVRLSVRYTEKSDGPLPELCPVCGADLVPIRNRTLTGETVVLGKSCPRCSYWTTRRVASQYATR